VEEKQIPGGPGMMPAGQVMRSQGLQTYGRENSVSWLSQMPGTLL
jgi:hypothetical protein